MVANKMCESENITCATGEGCIHENTDGGIQWLWALKDSFYCFHVALVQSKKRFGEKCEYVIT